MLRKLTKSDLPEIQDWWQPEPVPFVDCPDDAWMDYVIDHRDVVAVCSDAKIGGHRQIACYSQTDVEKVNGQTTGWIAMVTAPRFWRQGFARAHYLQLQQILAKRNVNRILAAISKRNIASVAFFASLGFLHIGQADDDPELQHFEKRIR